MKTSGRTDASAFRSPGRAGRKVRDEAARRPAVAPRPEARPAFTLVEVAVSVVVLALTLTACLHALGAARTGQVWNQVRLQGSALAGDLLAEIMARFYAEPDAVAVPFGPDLGESQADRQTLDDVDDFHNLVDVPLAVAGGGMLATGWRRTVRVAWVSPTNPAQTSLVETGIKRITVTVERNGVKVAELVALRTRAMAR